MIPTIFWNKEDPINFNSFSNTAKLFDFVFTTCIDTIDRYKIITKNNNIYFLPFAAQPREHNPIEVFERKDKYCFAGAYYTNHTERTEVFNEFCDYFISTKGLDIYDRNYGSSINQVVDQYIFPKRYNKCILGRLDTSEIFVAYKGYKYGINMNTVINSQTMHARRVFELMESNTVVIVNYSRAVRNFFGELTICSNNIDIIKKNIEKLCENDTDYRKYRLLGLRKVLKSNLYEDRLRDIVEKVFYKRITLRHETIILEIYSYIKSINELEYVINCFEKQSYSNKKLFLITSLEYKISVNYINIICDEESKI